MALPKINSSPAYNVTVPSTGDTIEFRPYLVKEEKVLMLAFESGDTKQATKAIGNTLNACVTTEGFDAFKLTTYDVEYLFTMLRTKSVGETSEVILKCSECETKNNVTINLDDVRIDDGAVKRDSVKLTDTVVVEMGYPVYGDLGKFSATGETMEDSINMLMACVSAVNTEDERYDRLSFTDNDLREFVESLTTDQFTKLAEFLKDIPKLEHEVGFVCSDCRHENSVVLTGMKDFLS